MNRVMNSISTRLVANKSAFSGARFLHMSRPCFVTAKEHIVIGGGPVGSSAAMYLAEREKECLLIHDGKDKGAYEDWSRLARLSVDGPKDEYEFSKYAIELLDTIDYVRSMNSGAPVVPIRPGMLFIASPGTAMAEACTRGEGFGDEDLKRLDPKDLDELYPGNKFTIPEDTLVWSHPVGLCVSPIELVDSNMRMAEAMGVEVVDGRASVELGPDGEYLVKAADETYSTRKLFMFAGAQNKEICQTSSSKDMHLPEFDYTYLSAISTIRYKHAFKTNPPTEGHVVPPIILGQIDVPGVDFQCNFSVVAEEYGDVFKCRLSGAMGTETIDTMKEKWSIPDTDNAAMESTYKKVFGSLFPFLHTEKMLDFNRCVTYRNHMPVFHGASLLEAEHEGGSRMFTTPGCFGVHVKFGPAVGQGAVASMCGEEVHEGIRIEKSGTVTMEESEDFIERAW